MKKFVHILSIVISVIYLLNPTAGVWEIIPDNLPIIGNLDEVAAVILLINSFRALMKKAPPEEIS